MKALRLVLTQSSANYRKPETVNNKMTYPLPPISTIIGAIHNACGYTQYVPMDISIQGNYESMYEKLYRDDCFLDSTQKDRGILVKVVNPDLLSSAYTVVAVARKSQGNDFEKEITIDVKNRKLLNEWKELKKEVNELTTTPKKIENEIKKIEKEQKKLNETDPIHIKHVEEISLLKKKKEEIEKLIYKLSFFKTLTKSVKKYEILTNLYLIIHIKAEENVLKDILDHAYDIKALGRSEDFVNVINAEIVDLDQNIEDEIESPYSAYINYDTVKNENVYTTKMTGRDTGGTIYYINKDYKIIDNKRIFNKKKVVYTSNYFADEPSDDIYVDTYNGEKILVNFI